MINFTLQFIKLTNYYFYCFETQNWSILIVFVCFFTQIEYSNSCNFKIVCNLDSYSNKLQR